MIFAIHRHELAMGKHVPYPEPPSQLPPHPRLSRALVSCSASCFELELVIYLT